MGTVKGTVMDSNGAAIVTPRPSIILEGKNGVTRVRANDSGDYEIKLPVGTYEITSDMPGFYPFRRAEFRVLPASTVMINIVLTPKYLVRGTTVSATESVDTPSALPKYNEFHIPGGPASLLIQFQKKRRANGNVEYDQAVLSYDALTIYSKKIYFNRTKLQLRAFGRSLVVEGGKQRVQVKQAEVTFKRGEPILKLTR